MNSIERSFYAPVMRHLASPNLASLTMAFLTMLLILSLPTFGEESTSSSKAKTRTAVSQFKTLLSDHWKSNTDSRNQLAKLQSNFRSTIASDADLFYSTILLQLKQNKTRDALKASNQLAKKYPDYVSGLYVNSWLLLIAKEDGQAIAAIKSFDAANDKLDDKHEFDRMENLRAIARMTAFLEGPRGTVISAREIRSLIHSVLTSATEEEKKIFESERQTGLKQFAELSAEKETADAKGKEAVKKKKDEQIKELNTKIDNLTKREKELTPKLDEIQERAEREYSRLEKRLDPIEDDLRDVNSDISDQNRRINMLVRDARYFELRAIDAIDEFSRDRDLARAERLYFSARREQNALVGLNREARNLAISLDRVRAEIADSEQKFAMQTREIQAELTSNRKLQTRLGRQIARGGKPVSSKNVKAHLLRQKAKSIRTYEDFPLEIERSRMIEVFSKRLK